ncbi:MAG: 2Fe-2S iron-sulfur cluster binding domain [Pseudomonadota bacterium]|jgi:ferredoxin
MPTPFGLRRRVRRLLGWPVPPVGRAADPAPAATSIPLSVTDPEGAEHTCEAPGGSTLLAASARLRRPIASGCADSTCGTCRVSVLDGAGHLSPQDDAERATLRAHGHPDTLRLACRAELRGGHVRVRAHEVL